MWFKRQLHIFKSIEFNLWFSKFDPGCLIKHFYQCTKSVEDWLWQQAREKRGRGGGLVASSDKGVMDTKRYRNSRDLSSWRPKWNKNTSLKSTEIWQLNKAVWFMKQRLWSPARHINFWTQYWYLQWLALKSMLDLSQGFSYSREQASV